MLVLMLTSSVVFAQKSYSLKGVEKTKTVSAELQKEYVQQQLMEEYEAAKAGLTEISLSNIADTKAATQQVAKVKKTNTNPSFIKDPNGANYDVKGVLDCPAGSQFSQSAVGYGTGVNSEVDPGNSVYQYYNGLAQDITSITFWGLKAYHDGTSWSACAEDPVDFAINFYGDNAGAPDLTNLLDSYTLSLAGFDTGELFAGSFPIYSYTHSFAVPVAITDAWVMIQGGGATDCWFLWVDSGTTGTLSYQDTGSGPAVTTYVQSMCLGGTLLNHDVGVVGVVTPQTGVLGATETVEVQITNFGANSEGNFDVNYTFGGNTFTETYVGPLASGATDTHTFATTIDCSVIGSYTLGSCTAMIGDEDGLNDCYTHNFDSEVPGYCAADAGTEDEFIVSVVVGTINDGPFVSDGITYHDNTATSTDMGQGTPYAMTVVNGTPYGGDQCTVWADWNQDLDFDDAGEMFTLATADNVTFTGTITPPVAATMGSTRMRIRLNYTAAPLPCGSATYGEVMDYSVNVVAGASCPAPTAQTATGITTTSADLGWTESGTAADWDVEYGLAGYTFGTGTTITGATNPQNITGLSSGTSYDWYVKAKCSPFDHSTWSGPHTFATVCVLSPPPGGIAETEVCGDDDNGGCNNDPDPATFEAVNPNDVILGTFFSSTTTKDTDWYEIVLDNTYSAYTITINADAVSSMNVLELTTPVMGTPTCPATVGLSMTVGPCTPGSFTTGTYAPGTYWFWAGSSVFEDLPCDQDYWMEFVVTPVLCPDPTALGVNAVTGTTADLTWTSDSGLSNIEYGAAGFTVGVDPIGTAAGVTSPYGITGLTEQTAYEFYVQDDCSGSVSGWAGPFAFTTMCATVGVPFAESFDVQADPACWTNTSSNPVSNGLWKYGQQGNNPAGWGAALVDDHTGNGGFFAFSDGSTPEVADIMLMTPLIDASSLTVPYLSFYVFSNNVDFPGDNVPLSVDFWDGAAWNTALTYAADNADWVFVGIDLSGYAITGDVQFKFTTDQTVTVNDAWYNDILIDDVMLDEMPTCLDPTALGVASLTFESADLEWTSNSGLSNLEFGLAGFTIGVDPIISVSGTTSPYAVSGLAETTDYEFYVQDDCGGGDLSNWVGPFGFTTPIATYMVSGTVDYNGTPMNYVTVNVMDGVTVVATDLTDGAGYFEFPMVPNGNFTYEATTNKVRGGTEVGDINLVINHILGGGLVGLQFSVADVSADGFVDVADLNELMNNILGTANGYPAVVDWFFDDAPVVVAGGDVSQDLPSLCSGDPNGDYLVPVEFPPANDLCSAAEAIVGPYPVTGIDGTTLYSTNDCPLLLDQNGEVWYAIDLPNAQNTLVLSYCGDGLMNNGWIIGTTVMCSCDQADYLFADTWDFAVPCVNDLTWDNIAGPTTFYVPISTGDFQEHFVLDVNVTAYVPAYCLAGGPTSAADSNVEQVDITGDAASAISHTGCPGVIGVEDLTAQSIDVTIGNTYSLDVTFGTCGGNYGGAGEIWIDWNGDLDFDDAGESIGTSAGTPGTAPWDAPVNFSITVPAGAVVGATHMRIMQRESGTNPLDPCGSYSWGSVMDFTVNVQ